VKNYLRITPVLCAAIGAAAGFYSLSDAPAAVTIAVLSVLLVTLCFFRVLSSLNAHSRELRLTAVCSVAFTAAVVLGICAASAGRTDVNFGISEDRITAIEGVLLEDPRIISGGRAMASLSLRKCAGGGSLRVSSRGEITVFFPQESAGKLREFGRGTAVFAEGRLRSSESGWTYGAESLHIVKPAPAIERMRTAVRLNLINRFERNPSGGLALALLLGIKDNLDTNLAALYRDAGLSYILALSGMHLAVLIAFLLKKPLGLKAAAIAGAVIIILYCFLVGPMPSLNRAALMYLLGTAAILFSLSKEPLSILSVSFLIQIVITPAAGYSISFILSYLALAGILIIGQPLYSLFCGKVPDFLLQPLSASCGAFLATAGVTGFVFGIIAPVGIIAGLVLVPLTTVFMIGSMIWLALDFLSLSGFLNFPLFLLYRLMEKIVSAAGGIPGISAWPFLILTLSLVLSLLIAALEYRRRAAVLRLQPFL
jgi:competence protein ComEC